MIRRSAVQFAVVREDPRIERDVIHEFGPQRALIVASGGCTALALRGWFPALDVVLVEPNPAQLTHVAAKLDALRRFEPARFNVGTDDPAGLHELGNFERLFRTLRHYLDLFVISAADRASRLADPDLGWDDVFAHEHWPVAFDLAFADSLLRTMFGPAAVQHAPAGSYPGYFRNRIEAGLRADDRALNPWLHHLLLGRYLDTPAAWPPFLRDRPIDLAPFATHPGTLLDVPDFAPFDLVQLSNILDWTDDDGCRQLADRLRRELRYGAVVLWRQLNDPRRLRSLFEPEFTFDDRRDARATARERSLFYDAVHIGLHR